MTDKTLFQGYQDTPGLYTQPQIDGWHRVTDAVHAKHIAASTHLFDQEKIT